MCLLCGSNKNLEWRSVDQVRPQVLERYIEGPFAWAALCEAKEKELLFCAHCLNHIRKRKRSRRRRMLPMDLYMLGLLSPKFSGYVDLRSQKRLKKVLSVKSNPYLRLGIAPLDVMVASDNKVCAWWELNLKTMYFPDCTAAKFVRSQIKEAR